MVRDPEFLQKVPDESKKDFNGRKGLETSRAKRLKKEVLERFPVSYLRTVTKLNYTFSNHYFLPSAPIL